ncbi:MAG: integrin alpha [Actinomycetota bacterium]|nr:integrin alpha [Actinomycetota bacterium]
MLSPPTAVRVVAPPGALNFGASVAGLGDVNGDGAGEVVVGAPGSDHAYVVSPATGTVLHEIAGPSQEALNFGFAVAAVGDVDGDAVVDLGVGAPSGVPTAGGQAFLFSAATGAVLRGLTPASGGAHAGFGQSVAASGDLSGDGVPDVVVASSASEHHAGSVFAFSGRDGAQLWSRSDPTPQSGTRTAFARAVAASPDVSGDGVADVLVAAPSPSVSSSSQPAPGGEDLVSGLLAGVLGVVASLTSTPPPGQVHVLSGVNGGVVRTISDPAAAPGDVFGAAMATIGDQDGDGMVDHLIAEAGANQLHVYSGRDGSLLGSNPVPGNVKAPAALALAQAGDKDGDGREDAWVGVPAARSAYLVSGSGAVLASSSSPSAQGSFGAAVATLARPSSGGAEVVVGDPTEPGGGAVYVVQTEPSVVVAAEPVLVRTQAQTATSTTVPSTTTTSTTVSTTTTAPTTTIGANGAGPTATLPKPPSAVTTDSVLPDTGGVDRSTLGALAMALGLGGITALRRRQQGRL